jgi:hypothetical protein
VAISPKEKTTLHKEFARQKTMQTDGLGIRLSPYHTYIPLKIKLRWGSGIQYFIAFTHTTPKKN